MYILCSVYLFTATFIRKIRTKSGTYLAEVRNKRVDGKVKQEFIRYIGKEMNGSPVRRISSADIKVMEIRRSLDVESVHRIAMKLGISSMIHKNASIMVYSQLLDRPSINRMPEYLKETEILRYLDITEVTTQDLYSSLEEINDMDFSGIEKKLSDMFLEIEKNKRTVVIDITDTYFTGDSLDSTPRKGKEGRIRKLIQIALVVTEKHGFPLMHRTYSGNVSNRMIMDDLVKDLWINGYTAIVVDRGMSDSQRIKSMLELNFTMICGLKKTPDLKKIIDTMDRNGIYTKNHRVKLKNTEVYCSSMDYLNGKIIVVFNPSMEAIKKAHYYEHSSDESIAGYLGYSLIYHNTSMTEGEIVKKYYDKDSVERAFKQMKGVLDLRPVRVWLRTHIEGHVKICYLSYAILSYLGYIMEKINISGPEALDALRSGYRVYLEDNSTGFKWEKMVTESAIQRKIMDVVIKKT